jgi:alcohol dehydrogenase class IV
MKDFIYEALPSHVTFGRGSVSRLHEVMERHGVERAMLLSTPQQVDQARAAVVGLGDAIVSSFTGATMHTPVEVTERALAELRDSGADCVVSFGGGSTIGLGKALAVRTDVLQIAVPTTYAGSEMTPILGETENGRKTTRRSPSILPEAVIYDVDLTMGLPAGISGTSGINAIAHAVEGLYAKDANPIMRLVAEEGIRSLASALPRVVAHGGDVEAREDAQYGAWLCGLVLGSVGMALHHKLCHTIGGDFDLPHAETHTIILPHAVAYNAPAIPDAMAAMRRALDTENPADALFVLARKVGAPRALKDIGMPEEGMETAADHAVENAYWNPRPLKREAIRDLIARAWAGDSPTGAGA